MTDFRANYNLDLKPSSTNPGPLDADRVWTICELIVYRERDQYHDEIAREHFNQAADEIRKVRKAWETWEKMR